MQCAEQGARLAAYFDGELDALDATDMERHLEGCENCRTTMEELGHLRKALRVDVKFDSTPAALKSRIVAALDSESVADSAVPRRISPRAGPVTLTFWSGALAGLSGGAIAACCAIFLWLPSRVNPLLDDLVNAHVRSLMPSHLIDVESTDRHTVKPWFAGHVDVSPVVADFGDRGYRLVGGRADYFARQRAAAVVYQHGAHIINVFSWRDAREALPFNTTRNGYHLAFWQAGNLDYCAISDTSWDELAKLETLIKASSADSDSDAEAGRRR